MTKLLHQFRFLLFIKLTYYSSIFNTNISYSFYLKVKDNIIVSSISLYELIVLYFIIYFFICLLCLWKFSLLLERYCFWLDERCGLLHPNLAI